MHASLRFLRKTITGTRWDNSASRNACFQNVIMTASFCLESTMSRRSQRMRLFLSFHPMIFRSESGFFFSPFFVGSKIGIFITSPSASLTLLLSAYPVFNSMLQQRSSGFPSSQVAQMSPCWVSDFFPFFKRLVAIPPDPAVCQNQSSLTPHENQRDSFLENDLSKSPPFDIISPQRMISSTLLPLPQSIKNGTHIDQIPL